MVTLYTITLTVTCCIAIALVMGRDRQVEDAAESSWVNPSTLAVYTASAATLSTLAYAMAGPDGANLLPLVIGDATMPLSVGLLVATLRRAAGKRRSFAISALVISIMVAAMTLFVSAEAGYVSKLFVLAAFSLLATLTCIREPFPALGAWLVGASTAFYAAYCVIRLAGAAVFIDDPVWGAVVGVETATIVATIAIAVITAGVIVIFRGAATGPTSIVSSEALTDWIGALLSQRSAFVAIAVSVPDRSLHRAAFGRAWAAAITEAVTDAIVAVMPSGSVIGRANSDVLVAIQFGPTFDLDIFRTRLAAAYHDRLPRWAPTDPPDLLTETMVIDHPSDVRRLARRTRFAARRAAALQGM